MREFPRQYPTQEAFLQASAIQPYSYYQEVAANPLDVAKVMELMTPREIRDKETHNPQIIQPDSLPTFDELLVLRQRIRDLEYAPSRSDDMQASYQQMQDETFLRIVREHYLANTQMALVREVYPSALGSDVQQYVVWVDDDTTPDYTIAEFITKVTSQAGLTPDDIILFERSRSTDTPYAKVAVSQHRHIHLWMRGKNEKTPKQDKPTFLNLISRHLSGAGLRRRIFAPTVVM